MRHALASGAPVALTPLSIFRDVHAASYLLPGCKPQELADGLLCWIRAHDERERSSRQRFAEAVAAEPALLITDGDTAMTTPEAQHGLRRPSQCWLENHAHRRIMLNLEGLISQLAR